MREWAPRCTTSRGAPSFSAATGGSIEDGRLASRLYEERFEFVRARRDALVFAVWVLT